jgi:hypothetical protein
MFTGRFFRFQRALVPPGDSVLQKPGTFRTQAAFTKAGGQTEKVFLRSPVPAMAVDLNEFAYQPDILFLVPGDCFHGCDTPPIPFDHT